MVTNFGFHIDMMPGNIWNYFVASLMLLIEPVIFEHIVFVYYVQSYIGTILTHIVSILFRILICLIFKKQLLPVALDPMLILQECIMRFFCILLRIYGGFLHSMILQWLAVVLWHLFLGGFTLHHKYL